MPSGCDYNAPLVPVCIRECYSYRRGLRVASFNNLGQCEGLYEWNGQQGQFHAFFVYPNLYTLFIIKLTESGTIGQYKRNDNSFFCMKTIFKARLKKALKFVIYWIAMFFAMNDKIGFPMKDELPPTKL